MIGKIGNFDRIYYEADIVDDLNLATARRPNREAKRVNVDFPAWMVESLDKEAQRLGVTRQSLIKLWLADRLEHKSHI